VPKFSATPTMFVVPFWEERFSTKAAFRAFNSFQNTTSVTPEFNKIPTAQIVGPIPHWLRSQPWMAMRQLSLFNTRADRQPTVLPTEHDLPRTGPHWLAAQPWWAAKQQQLFSECGDTPPAVATSDGSVSAVPGQGQYEKPFLQWFASTQLGLFDTNPDVNGPPAPGQTPSHGPYWTAAQPWRPLAWANPSNDQQPTVLPTEQGRVPSAQPHWTAAQRWTQLYLFNPSNDRQPLSLPSEPGRIPTAQPFWQSSQPWAALRQQVLFHTTNDVQPTSLPAEPGRTPTGQPHWTLAQPWNALRQVGTPPQDQPIVVVISDGTVAQVNSTLQPQPWWAAKQLSLFAPTNDIQPTVLPTAASVPATGPHWTLAQPWWSFRQTQLLSFVSDVPPIVVGVDGTIGWTNRPWMSGGSSYFGVAYNNTASVGLAGAVATGDQRRIIAQDRYRYLHKGFVSRPSQYPRESNY